MRRIPMTSTATLLALGAALLLGSLPVQAAEAETPLPLPDPRQPVLRVHGSNTIGASLTPALVRGMLEARGFTDIRLEVTAANEQRITARSADGQQAQFQLAAHGSSTGFAALRDGNADVAASSRPIKTQEVTELLPQGNLLDSKGEHVIAIDGLAIITSPRNLTRELSTEQLAQIFSGEITDWGQVGPYQGKINLYARDEQSGTWDTFKELVLTRNGKKLAAEGVRRYESSEQLSDMVAADPQGIGFIGLPYIRKAHALEISSGSSQSMAPTPELVASEDYPLSRRLFLYTSPQRDDWAQGLARFAESDAGQAIVEKTGFVPQSVRAMAVLPTDDMPAEYRELALKARRLSTTFRFAEGSSNLDNKAIRDIERVVSHLKQHDKLSGQVVLVGFGDPRANADHSMLISKLRAITVQRQLVKAGVLVRDNLGMGDAMPVADNQSEDGRRKNRRVEVWVY